VRLLVGHNVLQVAGFALLMASFVRAEAPDST
jgi:hypothetical protein